MVIRDELVKYTNDYLDIESSDDYAPNGLQIEGKPSISTIVTGVSACLPLIKKAIELKADAIFVHHGLFWIKENLALVGVKYQRVKLFIDNNINLFAYHLPLDIHPKIGNNVILAEKLGFICESKHAMNSIPNILSFGSVKQEQTSLEMKDLLTQVLNREPLHIFRDPKKSIKKIAWCSGGGQDNVTKAAELGADAYITGEVSLSSAHLAEDLGIDYFAAGHNATEVFGIKALGEMLAQKYNLRHFFVDINVLV